MATRYRYRVLSVLALIAMHLCAMAQSANPAKYAACYETKILSSHKSDIALGRYLPKRFRLRTEHVSQSTHYQVEILDSPTQWMISWWDMPDSGSLKIEWSTGYIGYRVF